MPSYTASQPTSRPDFVEPGDYLVEVINAAEAMSKAENPMIDLKLKVIPDGAILYDSLVFVPSATWKIDAFRAATGETVIADQEVNVEADDLIGRQAKARLSVEEWNGRNRNKVAAWLIPTPEKSKGKEVSDDDKPF